MVPRTMYRGVLLMNALLLLACGLLCRFKQGAKDVIRDLRAWCRQDGGPLALGVVRNGSRSGQPGSSTTK